VRHRMLSPDPGLLLLPLEANSRAHYTTERDAMDNRRQS
jgi:hypothetical protein